METCQVLAEFELGFPLNKDYVNTVIHEYLAQEGKPSSFGKSGVPGKEWWSNFLNVT